MSLVYTIETTIYEGIPCTRTCTLFATDNLEEAKERFKYYKELCSSNKGYKSNEYRLYEWDKKNNRIIDECDNY